MAKGITRKELKELRKPDEFLSLSHRFLDYARNHEREMTIAAAALAVVVTGAFGLRGYRQWQASKAQAAFRTAHAGFVAGKLESAATALAEVQRSWPRTPYGRLAGVYVGSAYAELGKSAEARAAFEATIAESREPLLQQIAHYNLGLLKQKDGDKAGAAKDFAAAAAIEGPLRGPAWFARLGTEQAFEESAGAGMEAVGELAPEPRAFVEARLGAKETAVEVEKE